MIHPKFKIRKDITEIEYDDCIYSAMVSLGDPGDFIGGHYNELTNVEVKELPEPVVYQNIDLFKKSV